MYVPKRAPFDMFDTKEKQKNLKLYVRRVFISDDCEDLIPDWLNFMKGVVDSEDLPLNISRETLQQNKILRVIKKNIVKKCIELFDELAENEEDYKKFWNAFSKNIKLGLHEDSQNRTKLTELLRFKTSKSKESEKSLKAYVEEMPEGQKDIYYVTGESVAAVSSSPFIEACKKRNYEVLFMVDPIDEYMVQQLKEYDGKKLVSLTKDGVTFDDTQDNDELSKKWEEFTKHTKELLGDKVEKVVVSQRLTDTPCILVTSEYGWSANMERIMKAQALSSGGMGAHMGSRKILEINPQHSIVKELNNKMNIDKNDKTVKDLVHLLYDTSLISSGFSLEDPSVFSSRIHKMIQLGLSIDELSDDDELDEISKEELPDLEDEDETEECKMEEID
jgi:molecular chaperone HtpG